MTLLAKTRILNKMLQRAAGKALDFREMTGVLCDSIKANIYVVNHKGMLLGDALTDTAGLNAVHRTVITDEICLSSELLTMLLKVEESVSSTEQEPRSPLLQQLAQIFNDGMITIVPIQGAGERLGTMFITAENTPLLEDDLILAEYGATMMAMELVRIQSEEREYELRSRAAVKAAINSLSYTEMEAVEHIIPELKENEGLLVASKIADRAGITRSVIVNALRKLEGAGVIETRSLGMKGTYIKLLNDQLIEYIRH